VLIFVFFFQMHIFSLEDAKEEMDEAILLTLFKGKDS
jgi:hypothetical protein